MPGLLPTRRHVPHGDDHPGPLRRARRAVHLLRPDLPAGRVRQPGVQLRPRNVRRLLRRQHDMRRRQTRYGVRSWRRAMRELQPDDRRRPVRLAKLGERRAVSVFDLHVQRQQLPAGMLRRERLRAGHAGHRLRHGRRRLHGLHDERHDLPRVTVRGRLSNGLKLRIRRRHSLPAHSQSIRVHPLALRVHSQRLQLDPLPLRTHSQRLQVDPLPLRTRSQRLRVDPMPLRTHPQRLQVDPLPLRTRSQRLQVDPLPSRTHLQRLRLDPLTRCRRLGS